MPNRFLHGNGEWCSTCCPDGPPEVLDRKLFRRGCNECAGYGRVEYGEHQVYSRMIAAKRGTPFTAQAFLGSDARSRD